MISTYTLATSGIHFGYDNVTHGILNDRGAPLTLPADPTQDISDLVQRFGTETKTKTPETIKISLGQGCNYSCGYCMQKDIGNPDERPPNGLTPTLIKSIRQRLDTSQTSRIELWGGETLLYWRDIVPIMEEFDRAGVTWYIPTNGTPLMEKHINFFAQLQGNVAMGISHDGPGHEQLRGKEFLHRKVDVFRQIAELPQGKVQYSFNPVISRTNYDLFAINDFFVDFLDRNNLPRKQLSYELGRVYDSTMAKNSTHHVICGPDILTYRELLLQYLRGHLSEYRAGGTPTLLATNLFHTGLGVVPYARTLSQQRPSIVRTNCGVDDSSLLTMDMMGNVRTCQNVDETFNSGSLMHIKGIKIKQVNLTRADKDPCKSCDVKRLCKSSCPLDLGDDVFNTNCALEKVHYRTIQRVAFELLFNDAVTLNLP